MPGNFHAHYARLIELLAAVETMELLLADPASLDRRVRAVAGVNDTEGVGAIEAPRGFLLHHYRVDEHGLIQQANLIIATGHNNLAMQRGILQAARHYLDNNPPAEGLLNRLEAVIRTFDLLPLLLHPCGGRHAAGGAPARPGQQHRGRTQTLRRTLSPGRCCTAGLRSSRPPTPCRNC